MNNDGKAAANDKEAAGDDGKDWTKNFMQRKVVDDGPRDSGHGVFQ